MCQCRPHVRTPYCDACPDSEGKRAWMRHRRKCEVHEQHGLMPASANECPLCFPERWCARHQRNIIDNHCDLCAEEGLSARERRAFLCEATLAGLRSGAGPHMAVEHAVEAWCMLVDA